MSARSATAAVMVKEWAQIWRDPSTIGLVLVLPLLLMFLFGSAVSLDTIATRTGMVDRDHSAASRDLVAAFARNPYFAIREAPAVEPLRPKTSRMGCAQSRLNSLTAPDSYRKWGVREA